MAPTATLPRHAPNGGPTMPTALVKDAAVERRGDIATAVSVLHVDSLFVVDGVTATVGLHLEVSSVILSGMLTLLPAASVRVTSAIRVGRGTIRLADGAELVVDVNAALCVAQQLKLIGGHVIILDKPINGAAVDMAGVSLQGSRATAPHVAVIDGDFVVEGPSIVAINTVLLSGLGSRFQMLHGEAPGVVQVDTVMAARGLYVSMNGSACGHKGCGPINVTTDVSLVFEAVKGVTPTPTRTPTHMMRIRTHSPTRSVTGVGAIGPVTLPVTEPVSPVELGYLVPVLVLFGLALILTCAFAIRRFGTCGAGASTQASATMPLLRTTATGSRPNISWW